MGWGMRRTRQCGGGAVRRCRAGMGAGEVRGVWSHRGRRVACPQAERKRAQGPSLGAHQMHVSFIYVKTHYAALSRYSRVGKSFVCTWSGCGFESRALLIFLNFFFLRRLRRVTKSQSQPARDISTDASPDGLVASCFLCGVLFCGPLATAMCSKLPGRPCARVPTGACQHTRLCQHLKGKWPRPRACPCAGLECQIPLKIRRKGSSGAQKGACS